MFNIAQQLFKGEVSSTMIAPILSFPHQPLATRGTLDSGNRSDMMHIMLRSDGPGVVEVPELEVPRIAVYIGKPVRLNCRHGAQSHSGLAIHGDIDIIPDRMASSWEMKGVDTALVIRLGRQSIYQVSETSFDERHVEIRSRFRVRDPQIEHIAWALMAEAQNGYPSGRLYLDCMATALAVQLLRNHSSLALMRPLERCEMPPRTLRQIQCYIEENLRCDLSLAALAEVARMSVSHLKTTFRSATGIPVHQYVIRRRVEHAALLLRECKLPISQIAIEVGFAHQSHLALHTKSLLGASPSQVRRLSHC